MHTLTDRDDNELIESAIGGDKHAYGTLVRRYQRLVYNVVYQIVKNEEVATDMAQDAFIKAYQALPTFSRGRPLRPWLLRIATNCALNHLRSTRQYRSLDELLSESPAEEPASSYSVEGDVENRMIQAKLGEVLASLQPQHRHIFLLKYQHDLSYEEIGQITDQSITTVKSLLFRVRSKVRQLMKCMS